MNKLQAVPAPSAQFLAFCDAVSLPMTVTAYRAGYVLGEVARETGGDMLSPMPPEIEELYNSECIDGVERDLIEDAFNDGVEAGYYGQDPLTDTQICIHYD
jgi:hypothetical protein